LAFLHFLCTPCGQSEAPFHRISRAPRISHKNSAIQCSNNSSLLRCFLHVAPRKSAAIFFLNCTKNTELTRARFARTVTFAFIKIKSSRPGHTGGRSHSNFTQKDAYTGQRAMKSEQWKTYRTRFLVKAKQLSSSLSFVDHLGRQHCGRKGDYLVESSDGVLSIAPRRIFEDIYVPMSLSQEPGIGEPSLAEDSLTEKPVREPFERPKFEPLEIEEVKLEPSKLEQVKLGKPPVGSRRVDNHLIAPHDNVREVEPARVRRKLPQPCGDRRASTPRLQLM